MSGPHPSPPNGQTPGQVVLDVVVPVHDEEHTVAACVRRLHHHLVATYPYPFRITVADNASTDRTSEVAAGLAESLPGVVLVRLAEKGRGRALKHVWAASDALVLAYMDVDLSTDLDALWPLVAPLMSGHSDLAIGTRLHRDSRVVRGPRRELVSRGYNAILKASLGASFSDAQCGFKAIRADVAAALLPMVEDTGWFFDTELLVLAQRCGLRIHEVPVDWWDDPDSRVDVVATARDDLRGVRRLQRTLPGLPTERIRTRMGRTVPTAGVGAQTVRFGLVGVATTVLHLGLFALLAPAWPAQVANVAALLLATLANTSANRRFTFGVRGPGGAWRAQLQGLAVFVLFWAVTAGGLALLPAETPTAVQTLVVGCANVVATATKFVAMRSWIFAPGAAVSDDEVLAEAGRSDATAAAGP
jgi:putative flippase GtrA